MSTHSVSPVLQIVRDAFPGLFNVDVVPAAAFIGMAEQTARNKLHLGEFPLKTTKQGRRRLVSIVEIAAYLEGQIAAAGTESGRVFKELPSPTPQKRAGKPANALVEGGAL